MCALWIHLHNSTVDSSGVVDLEVSRISGECQEVFLMSNKCQGYTVSLSYIFFHMEAYEMIEYSKKKEYSE